MNDPDGLEQRRAAAEESYALDCEMSDLLTDEADTDADYLACYGDEVAS